MKNFNYRTMLVKVATVAIAVSAGTFTGGQIPDLLISMGVSLTSEEAQALGAVITVLIPSLYAGIQNRVKHSDWFKDWKASKAAKASIALLCCGFSLYGCETLRIKTTSTITDSAGNITVTVTEQMDPFVMQMTMKGLDASIALLDKKLEQDGQLSEKDRAKLEAQKKRDEMLYSALQTAMAWMRAHPGQALPKDMQDGINAASQSNSVS